MSEVKVPSFLFRLYLSRREAKLILNRMALTEEEIQEKPWKGRLQNNLIDLIKRSKAKNSNEVQNVS